SLCSSIAQVTGHVGGGTFAAGLLHDIGQLVMFHHCETLMIDVMEIATHREDVTLVQAEDNVLGFNHAEVGAALALRWGLPESIMQAIAYHHRADWPNYFLPSIAIVAYANKIATRLNNPTYVPIRPDAPQMQRIGEVIDVSAVDEAAMLAVARSVAEDMMLAAA
ncbi:MAG: HDOD domain-containing protein, partial [Gammaproteobacteria bacterium]